MTGFVWVCIAALSLSAILLPSVVCTLRSRSFSSLSNLYLSRMEPPNELVHALNILSKTPNARAPQ